MVATVLDLQQTACFLAVTADRGAFGKVQIRGQPGAQNLEQSPDVGAGDHRVHLGQGRQFIRLGRRVAARHQDTRRRGTPLGLVNHLSGLPVGNVGHRTGEQDVHLRLVVERHDRKARGGQLPSHAFRVISADLASKPADGDSRFPDFVQRFTSIAASSERI